MPKNNPVNETKTFLYDPHLWTRLEYNSIPIYVNRDQPDWFIPNQVGDQLLSQLAAGGPYPPDLESRLFLDRLPAHQPVDLSRLPTSLSTTHLRECWLHITNNCNQACTHCLFACSPGEKESLSLQQIISLTDQTTNLGCRIFALTGGEPLVHPEFTAIVDHLLLNKENHVAVLTNGMPLHRLMDKLQHWPKTNFHLQISIDGLKNEHDSLRGQGAFDGLMQELKFLQQQEIPFTLSMCVTDANVHLIPDIVDLAAKMGVPNVHFMWYFIRGRGQSKSFLISTKVQLNAAIFQVEARL